MFSASLSLSLILASFFHERSDSSLALFSTSDFNCSNSSSIFFGKFVASEMKFTVSVANLSRTVSASALPRKKASNGLSPLLLLLLSSLFEFGLEEKIRNVSFLFLSLLPGTFARTTREEEEEEEEEEENEDDDKRRLESAKTDGTTKATGMCARSSFLFFFMKRRRTSVVLFPVSRATTTTTGTAR
jgi:hypothetical protein